MRHTIDTDRCVEEIWTCGTIPKAELFNMDFLPAQGGKISPELPIKPDRLELKLIWKLDFRM
jgi:hypothetical protein